MSFGATFVAVGNPLVRMISAPLATTVPFGCLCWLPSYSHFGSSYEIGRPVRFCNSSTIASIGRALSATFRVSSRVEPSGGRLFWLPRPPRPLLLPPLLLPPLLLPPLLFPPLL